MSRRLTGYVRKLKCACIGAKELSTTEFYQPGMVDPFLVEKVKAGDQVIEIHTSDIYMLFNQKRLDKLTAQALVQHFDSMSQQNSSLSSLRSKLTDDQLVQFVKSRYIQSPGELLAWSKYLVSLYGEDYAKFQELTQSKQVQQQEPQQQAAQQSSTSQTE